MMMSRNNVIEDNFIKRAITPKTADKKGVFVAVSSDAAILCI